MKQTAVEWLIEQMKTKQFIYLDRTEILNQTKELEKQNEGYSEENMKEAFNVGFNVGYNDETSPSYLTFEQFIEQFKNK